MDQTQVRPVGVLAHEVAAGHRGDAARFDHEGYAVGRRMFAPEVLRELRAPLIEALRADGQVELVHGEPDRFRWVGAAGTFDRDRYRAVAVASTDDLLIRGGVASNAIGAVWGRRPAMWDYAGLYTMLPGDPTRVHRDGWQMMGAGGPEEHLNVWVPLTRLAIEDGPLAIATGSHRLPDRAARIIMPHPVHLDVHANTGHLPPPQELAPLWHSTPFEVGDALLFRPDIVHSTVVNTGPYLRLAVGIGGQDARRPLALKAGLSPDITRDLAQVEWFVLALLAAHPSSPWLARCAFYPRGILGRIGVRHPDDLVERAFITLDGRGLIEGHTPGEDDDPLHRYFHATPRGHTEVATWLGTQDLGDPQDRPLFAAKSLLATWLSAHPTTSP